MKKRTPSKREVAKARRFLDLNWSLIALHTLYQRWGLPTATLSPTRKKAKKT